MENEKTILVKDACILIDLIQLEILDIFLQTQYSVVTTEAVLGEITDQEQAELVRKYIKGGSLQCEPDGGLFEVLTLQRKYRGISYQDATALELAKRTGGKLLSADGLLRKAGIKEQITVNGTLWVIHELYIMGFIKNSVAIQKVKTLMAINGRISANICNKLIKKFEGL